MSNYHITFDGIVKPKPFASLEAAIAHAKQFELTTPRSPLGIESDDGREWEWDGQAFIEASS